MKEQQSLSVEANRTAQSTTKGARKITRGFDFLNYPAIESCNGVFEQIQPPLSRDELTSGYITIFAAQRQRLALPEIGYYHISDENWPPKDCILRYHETIFKKGGLRAFKIVKSVLPVSDRARSESTGYSPHPSVQVHGSFAAAVMTISLVHMWIDNNPMPYDYPSCQLEISWQKAAEVFLNGLRSQMPYSWFDFFLHGDRLTPVLDLQDEHDRASEFASTAENRRTPELGANTCIRTPELSSSQLIKSDEESRPSHNPMRQPGMTVDNPSNIPPQQSPVHTKPAEGLSKPSPRSSLASQAASKEVQRRSRQGDAGDVWIERPNMLVLPIHNKIDVQKDIGASAISISDRAKMIAEKREAIMKQDHECPSRNLLRKASRDALCWCEACFQIGTSSGDRVYFVTDQGYVEVWTDMPKPKLFYSSAALCFCNTLPFRAETVTEDDAYNPDSRKLGENSDKRELLLNRRDYYIIKHKDNKFKYIEKTSSQQHSYAVGNRLQPPSFTHQRQSSAPENITFRLEEHSHPGSQAGLDRFDKVESKAKNSPFSAFYIPGFGPNTSRSSLSPPKLSDLPDEICWCCDFCWVTRTPAAWRNGNREGGPRHGGSGTEIGHRVFFCGIDGNKVEVWTDLPKPRDAWTGVEKARCKMSPRHVVDVKCTIFQTERLTQSDVKREILLQCRDPCFHPPRARRTSDAGDTRRTNENPAPGLGEASKSGSALRAASQDVAGATKGGNDFKLPPSNFLQLPSSGRQRRSSAPETLKMRDETRNGPGSED